MGNQVRTLTLGLSRSGNLPVSPPHRPLFFIFLGQSLSLLRSSMNYSKGCGYFLQSKTLLDNYPRDICDIESRHFPVNSSIFSRLGFILAALPRLLPVTAKYIFATAGKSTFQSIQYVSSLCCMQARLVHCYESILSLLLIA